MRPFITNYFITWSSMKLYSSLISHSATWKKQCCFPKGSLRSCFLMCKAFLPTWSKNTKCSKRVSISGCKAYREHTLVVQASAGTSVSLCRWLHRMTSLKIFRCTTHRRTMSLKQRFWPRRLYSNKKTKRNPSGLRFFFYADLRHFLQHSIRLTRFFADEGLRFKTLI